ncbi:MAG: FHA domain-containing protein [Pseudomonadota bacterium]
MYRLQPTIDESLAPVTVSGPLTPIGREEAALADYPDSALAGLERRHARLILEGGALLLIDLSMDSTSTRNGEPVGAGPVPVQPGDLLCFGGSLEFRVEAPPHAELDATRLLEQPADCGKLLLIPSVDDALAAPIAITDFPFLIAKSDGHFASYATSHPKAVNFLSRRHAHVYCAQGQLWLEDLGSTNGTRVNGERLKEQAVVLDSGDEVRFGHKDFTFEVVLIPAEDPEHPTARALPDGTVLISSAGSFLDVYCNDALDEVSAEQPSGSGTSPAAAAATPAQTLRRLARSGRLRWEQAPYLRERQLFTFVGLPLLVLGFVAALSLRDDRAGEIDELLASGQAEAALTLAASYEQDHQEDPEAGQKLRLAFEEAVLPGWIERMAAARFEAADDHLQAQLAIAGQLADSRLSELLRWMSQLAQFSTSRGAASRVTLGGDNAQIQALAAGWDSGSDQFTRLLRRLGDAYPALAPLHAEAMSRIRTIQGEGADQLQAVALLREQVDDLIEQSQFDTAVSTLGRFAEDHPDIGGVPAYTTDLTLYAELARARASAALTEYLEAAEDAQFVTDDFRARKRLMVPEIAAAQAVQDALGDAQALWSNGSLAEAQAVLAGSFEAPWQRLVATRAEHFGMLQTRFAALRGLVGSEEYPDAVIDFYTLLDPQADRFMYDALAEDFASHRERALANAAEMARQGETLWQRYQDSFEGVGGGLRLEPEVTERFRALAQQLTDSSRALARAHRLFELLDTPAPATLAQQYQAATEEIDRQRSALRSLRPVLGAELVRAKLALLPGEAQGV